MTVIGSAGRGLVGLAVAAVLTLPILGAQVGPSPAGATRSDTVPTFRHSDHRGVGCRACHVMTPAHGTSLVRSVEDCRSCHHVPDVRDCGACHEGAERREAVYLLPRTFTPTVAAEPSIRDLPFRHDVHGDLACVGCHTGGPSLSVPDLDCRSCHEVHHAATSDCSQCHRSPEPEVHEEAAHLTCSGAGCHQDVPVEGSPRSREGCLWCHAGMADHEPDRTCVRCHLLPPPEVARPP